MSVLDEPDSYSTPDPRDDWDREGNSDQSALPTSNSTLGPRKDRATSTKILSAPKTLILSHSRILMATRTVEANPISVPSPSQHSIASFQQFDILPFSQFPRSSLQQNLLSPYPQDPVAEQGLEKNISVQELLSTAISTNSGTVCHVYNWSF